MKFKLLLALFFVVALVPVASSISVDSESNLSKGEAFIAKISGKFVDPPLENKIYFYRDNQAVPFDFKLSKIKGDYYIYSPTKDKPSGNYSLVIENVEYYVQGGQTSSQDIERDFRISSDYASFYASPVILESIGGKFSLSVENFESEEIKIGVKEDFNTSQEDEGGFFGSIFGGSSSQSFDERTFKVGVSDTKEVDFDLENTSDNELRDISLKSGEFIQPVFVHVLEGEQEVSEQNNETKEKDIEFEQEEFNISISTNSSTSRILYLENVGKSLLDNISLSVSESLEGYLNVSPEEIVGFDPNETEKVIVNVSTGNLPEKVDGVVKAEIDNGNNAYAGFKVNILESFIEGSNDTEDQEFNSTINESGPISENGSTEESKPDDRLPCKKLNGTICTAGEEECSGETTRSESGRCCLDQCVKKDDDSSVGVIVGWSILGLLVLVYIWFYFKKYRKTKNKPNISKVANKKSSSK